MTFQDVRRILMTRGSSGIQYAATDVTAFLYFRLYRFYLCSFFAPSAGSLARQVIAA